MNTSLDCLVAHVTCVCYMGIKAWHAVEPNTVVDVKFVRQVAIAKKTTKMVGVVALPISFRDDIIKYQL